MPDKLPRQYSWPLKPSDFDDLQAAFPDVSFGFSGRKPIEGRVVSASSEPWPDGSGAYQSVSIYPVAAVDRHRVRSLLTSRGLPAVRQWLLDIVTGSPTQQGRRLGHVWWVDGDDLRDREEG